MTEKATSTSETSSQFARHPARRRVVITGLGTVNPLGTTLEAVWHSLEQGKSGIRPIQLFDASPLPTRIAGEVPDFNAKDYIEKKERKNLRVMARGIQLAVAGAQLALDDAGIDKSKLDPTRFGVEFGAGLMATELAELAGAAQASATGQPGLVDLEKWGAEGISRIPPLWMLKYLPNMPACHISILHNAQGPNNTITEGDVAGLLAAGEAYRIIQRDQADFFLVGGTDSKMNPLSMVRQCLFSKLSKRNETPEKASRPFDAQRDGLVVGEGAGVIVLEEKQHAEARGARIYAEVAGFGSAFDARKNGGGLARAVQAALSEAQIGPDQLDHINVHGLSTVVADIWEAGGLGQALGDFLSSVPVFAAKSYFGNLGAASGPTELITSLLAFEHGTLPATLNYEHADSRCPLSVKSENQTISRPYFLKINFTDMGQCGALVCRKW